VLLLLATASCKGVQVRHFTRESYQPPPEPTRSSRVFEAPREQVWSAVVAVLRARSARFDEHDPVGGQLLVALPWATPEEAAASVDLGRIRKVETRTERSYRSYSPLDYNCNACVVRNGSITAQNTEIVQDVTVVLDTHRYRVEALLGAEVVAIGSGTQVELSLDLGADPPEPPGLRPRSTGHLESVLFAAVEELLEPGPDELR
jgi:hypothetical protein